MSLPTATLEPFYVAFRGSFTSILSWAQLDDFWRTLRANAAAGWYVYALGEAPPQQALTREQVIRFINAIDVLLHEDHYEDYCGIVYTDSKTKPSFIKIFDPFHLGSSCGGSGEPAIPGWIMSLTPPLVLETARPLPENRRRWWRQLWA
jgi:hypothetical protein